MSEQGASWGQGVGGGGGGERSRPPPPESFYTCCEGHVHQGGGEQRVRATGSWHSVCDSQERGACHKELKTQEHVGVGHVDEQGSGVSAMTPRTPSLGKPAGS